MYAGIADWTLIGEVKNNPRMHIPVIGNGDITNADIAWKMKQNYGVDAIMIGRAAIGNPWIFEEIKQFCQNGIHMEAPSFQERIDVCLRHLRLAVEKKQERKALLEIRKHYAGYFRGIPNFKQTRMKLLTLINLAEIEELLQGLRDDEQV